MASLVFFITGTSSGLGGELVKYVLSQGHRVIATARNLEKIAHLAELGVATLTLELTASEAEIKRTVEAAIAVYGRIDVLINNAGQLLLGAVEEVSAEECQQHFQVNVFGQLAIARAVLPHMRSRRSGTIANIGSVAGWNGAPGMGYYCASKAALASLTLALRREVAHLGVAVTVIEPGHFRTSVLAQATAARTIADYEHSPASETKAEFRELDGRQPGDPAKGARRIVEMLTGTGGAVGGVLPGRFLLGEDALAIMTVVSGRFKDETDVWRSMSVGTDFD